jgi:hypothetical protein
MHRSTAKPVELKQFLAAQQQAWVALQAKIAEFEALL